MKVSDLDLDSQSINFLHSEGFTELYEPQEYSVDAGICLLYTSDAADE